MTNPFSRAAALAVAALLFAACGGSDSSDGDSSSGEGAGDGGGRAAVAGTVGGDPATVDDVAVTVASAGLSEIGGDPAVALIVSSTNNGDAAQPAPQPYVVCSNGTIALDKGDGDYPSGSQIEPGGTVEGEVLLGFGSVDGQTCERPIEIDVRFGTTRGGIVNLTDASLGSAVFSLDDALADEIDATIFAG